MFTNYHNRKKIVTVLYLICTISILFYIWFSNYFAHPYNVPPGDDPAFHIQTATQIDAVHNLSMQPFGYPPGYHIFLSLLHKYTGISYENILIFFPLTIITVILPLLIWILLSRASNLFTALLSLFSYVLFTGVLGDFYSGGQSLELLALSFGILAGLLFVERKYAGALIILITIGVFHHLTIFPFIICLIVIVCYVLAYKRQMLSGVKIKSIHVIVGTLITLIIILSSWGLYYSIFLGLISNIFPKIGVSLTQDGFQVSNTFSRASERINVDSQLFLKIWRTPSFFLLLTTIALIYILIYLFIKKSPSIKKKFLYIFLVGWIAGDLFLAYFSNVGSDRLIRQAIIPAIVIVSVLFATIFKKFYRQAITPIIICSLIIIQIPLVNNLSNNTFSPQRFVRLLPEDFEALSFLHGQLQKESGRVLTPIIYVSWLNLYSSNSFDYAMIRSRITTKTEKDFWSILDTGNAEIAKQYNIRYIYLGHPTLDVDYNLMNVDERQLVKTGQWEKIFQSGDIRVLKLVTHS